MWAPKYDVELIGVSKRYGTTLAVDNISLRIPQASYCCLLGPSGCGKTSTLRMIAGHEAVSDGDILILTRTCPNCRLHGAGTGMMFQSYALFLHLNGLDNVAFSSRCAASPRPSGMPGPSVAIRQDQKYSPEPGLRGRSSDHGPGSGQPYPIVNQE
jgi:ABC-type Fe3+/spermidine/putrescine transport system ATPase subunit